MHQEPRSILERIHVQKESQGVRENKDSGSGSERKGNWTSSPRVCSGHVPLSSRSLRTKKCHVTVQIASASSRNKTGRAMQPGLGVTGWDIADRGRELADPASTAGTELPPRTKSLGHWTGAAGPGLTQCSSGRSTDRGWHLHGSVSDITGDFCGTREREADSTLSQPQGREKWGVPEGIWAPRK